MCSRRHGFRLRSGSVNGFERNRTLTHFSELQTLRVFALDKALGSLHGQMPSAGTKARLMKGRVWHPMLRRLEVPLQLSSYWFQVNHGWPMSRPTQLQSRRCPVSLQIVNALELLSREYRHPSSRSQSDKTSHEIPQRPLSQSQPLKTRCCSSSILSEKGKSWRKSHAENIKFDRCFLGPQESFHMRKKGTR